ENQALGNGSIILMHNGTKYTKDALDRLLKEVKKKGYRFVPVSRLIYQKNYYIDHTGRQIQKAKR
ncbi:MAG: polysaccharide deacetylase family protein, partial [Lachnospiraceae bacterium]